MYTIWTILSRLITDHSQLLFFFNLPFSPFNQEKKSVTELLLNNGACIKSRCLYCHILSWGLKWKSRGTISERITVRLHEVWTPFFLFHYLLVSGDSETQKAVIFKDIGARRSGSKRLAWERIDVDLFVKLLKKKLCGFVLILSLFTFLNVQGFDNKCAVIKSRSKIQLCIRNMSI